MGGDPMGDVKGEVKKITVRLNLQNSTDARIWAKIEKQIQQKQGNNYLKELILLGLQQEEQTVVLEEIREIKQLLMENRGKWSLEENEETAGLKKTESSEDSEEEEEIPEREEEQPEPTGDEPMEEKVSVDIDPEVMDFLDNL